MEEKNNNEHRTRWMLTIGFAVLIYIFWRYAYPCALAYHEQMQLFLWNGDYLMERVAEPGGVARYLAEMVVQFYNNLPFGAFLLTLLFVALQRISWLLMRRWGCKNVMKRYLLSFVTPIIIWALMGDKDVMTTFPMALLLTLCMLLLAPKEENMVSGRKGYKAILYLLLLLTIGYWMVGPLAIWAALCLVCCWLMRHTEKFRSAVVLLMVAIVGLFVQLVSAKMLPYPKSLVFRGIDYLRDPTAFYPHEWYTSDVYEQMEYSLLVRRQDWHGILEKASRMAPASTAGEAAVKLAQWKTGSLSDEEMRQFMASYGKLDHPINICMKSDLFYHLGLVNASRRYAFEFKQLISNGNQSGRMLKRLAETELVSGHEKLARKYLYILHDATFYRQWAEETLPLTYDRKLLSAHPIYGILMKSFPKKDIMY